MRVTTKLDEHRNRSKLMERSGSISLGIVLMPRKNGDFGVEHLPIILGLTFGSDWRRGCKFYEVPRHQLSSGAIFCAKTLSGA